MSSQTNDHDSPDSARPRLLNALTSLTDILDSISALPGAFEESPAYGSHGVRFKEVDVALLDTMDSCVVSLRARHSSGDPKSSRGVVGSERAKRAKENSGGDGKGGERRTKQSPELERLNHELAELALNIDLLGSSGEVDMSGPCVVDGDGGKSASTGELNAKVNEEEWVDVLKEDAAGKDDNNNTAKGSKERVPEEEEDKLLSPLSVERKNEILATISKTTSRILTTVQSLQLSMYPKVQILDFLGNTYELPSVDLASQLKTRYEKGPGSLHMKDGHFELLELEDTSAITNQGIDGSRDGMKKFRLVLVLRELPDVGPGRCPMPDCNACFGKAAVDGGWICFKCGVRFYGTAPSLKQGDHNAALDVGVSVSTAASAGQSGEISTSMRSIPRKPQADGLEEVKYVKTTDMITFPKPVRDADNFFTCRNCRTHLALLTEIRSRNFRGHHGKAYLFSSVVNVTRGATMDRNMTTGKHQVCDIFCRQCGECLGWGYEGASEVSESYKIGKVILEMEMVTDEALFGDEEQCEIIA